MNLIQFADLPDSALFRGIRGDNLLEALACLSPKRSRFGKDEVMALAGDATDSIGILLSGKAIVTKESAKGDRIVMAVLAPGDVFGEIAVFAGEGVWPATVTAQEPTEALFVLAERIIVGCERSCCAHRALTQNAIRLVSRKALMLSRKLEYLSMKTLRGKICAFLLEEHRRTGTNTFFMSLSRDDFADFLHVSRPSLSREMGRMRDDGLIEFHRAAIKLVDLNRLKDCVE